MSKTMMIINQKWGEEDSFRLIPLTDECPFLEAVFDSDSKALAVISKMKKSAYRYVPKVDSTGQPQLIKGKSGNPPTQATERKLMETFHEYYIQEPTDIRTFLEQMTINSKEYQSYTESLIVPVEGKSEPLMEPMRVMGQFEKEAVV